ncbi:hypothetical protein GCM10007863_40190 [Dyella mobilis]|uniref:Ribbon-helix-helix domain-containing protein n=2 Tax=Dyella mobilis TaxID=1849582 RepID=A0ABS2KCG0_9GAMM|nr:ribbon-helix-helix domain-containing protein [Dyella mobilis]GLQ99599.1 hypothetical protein GCM10007863_40190 [Dyella mobilis]
MDAMDLVKNEVLGLGVGENFTTLDDFDMALARPYARSMRLNGKPTCLRLEHIYWQLLRYVALHTGRSESVLLADLDREVQMRFGQVKNFSSLVRVVSVAQVIKACPGLLSR